VNEGSHFLTQVTKPSLLVIRHGAPRQRGGCKSQRWNRNSAPNISPAGPRSTPSATAIKVPTGNMGTQCMGYPSGKISTRRSHGPVRACGPVPAIALAAGAPSDPVVCTNSPPKPEPTSVLASVTLARSTCVSVSCQTRHGEPASAICYTGCNGGGSSTEPTDGAQYSQRCCVATPKPVHTCRCAPGNRGFAPHAGSVGNEDGVAAAQSEPTQHSISRAA
jgi:hypothetical protein